MNTSNVLKNIERIDASHEVMGRFCTRIAHMLLKENKKIVVYNIDKLIFKKKLDHTVELYQAKIRRGSKEKGPFYPRTSKGIFLRILRGMFNRYNAEHREKLKNIKVERDIDHKLESFQSGNQNQNLIRSCIFRDVIIKLNGGNYRYE